MLMSPDLTVPKTEIYPGIRGDMSKMTLIVLAAGLGTRLGAEPSVCSKAMTPIAGKPMLARLLDYTAKFPFIQTVVALRVEDKGARDFLVSRGFEINCYGAERSVSLRSTSCGLDTLYYAAQLLDKQIDCWRKCVVMTVDTVFQPSCFEEYLHYLQRSDADAVMAVTSYLDDEKPLYVVSEGDRVMKFSSTPSATSDLESYISGGIYGLSANALSVIKDCKLGGMTRLREFQQTLIEKGVDVRCYDMGRIVDVDRPEDIATALDIID